MSKRLKQLVLYYGDHPRHVCPVLRVRAPAEQAGIFVHHGTERAEGKLLSFPERIADADIVIIQRDFPSHTEAYEQVLDLARKENKPVIYDIDDLLIDLPPDHPDVTRYVPRRLTSLRAIVEADAVTVASEPLRAYLSEFNPNVHLLPNYLLDSSWEACWKKDQGQVGGDDVVTIGYMGGHSHAPDLEMVLPVFDTVLDKYGDNVRLHFYGIAPPGELGDDARVTATNVGYVDYFRFIDEFCEHDFDIFIAPLKDTPFNRHKSWLKFLEYSARGVPGVYTNLEPYRGIIKHNRTGFLASSLEDWERYLSTLIEDPELRITVGREALAEVKQGYLLSDHAVEWGEVYKQVLEAELEPNTKAQITRSYQLATDWYQQLLNEHDLQVESLESFAEENQVLSEHLQQHKSQLEVSEQKNRALRENIQTQKQEIARLRDQFTDLESLQAQTEALVAERDQLILRRDRELSEISGKLVKAEEDLKMIPGLERRLQAATQRLFELNSELQNSKKHIDALERRGVRRRVLINEFAQSWLLKNIQRLRNRLNRAGLGLLRRFGLVKPLPLFDGNWYQEQWPDVANSGIDPYVHYLLWGWRQGRNPSPYFDVIWYLRTYADVLEEGIEPLRHYLVYGRWEDRKPIPEPAKDPFPIHQSPWVPASHLSQHRRPGIQRLFDHLQVQFKWWRSSLALRVGWVEVPPLFNSEWYLEQNPDVVASGVNPYLHYRVIGWKEGRDPHPNFSVRRYLENYPDVQDSGAEPFEHFLLYGWIEGRNPSNRIQTSSFLEQVDENPYIGLVSLMEGSSSPLPMAGKQAPAHKGPRPELTFERTPQWPAHTTEDGGVPLLRETELRDEIELAFKRRGELDQYEPELKVQFGELPIKLIAFYLPQFHPVPENDEFWGKGFTEWTNVAKARPLFPGHYQPRLPGDLGFYDLRVEQVMREQVALAKRHGIYGFCFHHYWFNGRRVLDRPINQFLENKDIDFKFCINWANENWTRRWDGADDEILLLQKHTPADDEAFIQDAMRYFKDSRYILVENKPLFILYNPLKLYDPRETAVRWEEACRQEGFEGIFLVAAQTFRFEDPRPIGFDAAVEFPPHNAYIRKDISDQINFYTEFSGFVAEYSGLVENYRSKDKDYCLFRTVTPAWDNTARRGPFASIYHGSTPSKYQAWLESALKDTLANRPPSSRFAFINAWNEWAESAYLEPDRKLGYAYLNATSRALQAKAVGKTRLVFVGHDAYRAGAQIILLNILRWLKAHTHLDLRIVLGRGGALEDQYHKIAPTIVLDDYLDLDEQEIEAVIQNFCGDDVKLIYANSAASGWVLPYLEVLNAPILTHIHELQKSIDKFVGSEVFSIIRDVSERLIAVSPPVRDNLIERHQIPADRIDLVHEFLDPASTEADAAIHDRSNLNLAEDALIVLGCGTADWRKGPDLFLDVAEELKRRGHQGFHFYWIGDPSPEFMNVDAELTKRNLGDLVTFVGEVDNVRPYFSQGDVFLLTSREDPYPLVALEAAEAGLPIVCFQDSGGIPAFVKSKGMDAGIVVPFEDTLSMADAVEKLLENVQLRTSLGGSARDKFLQNHTVTIAMPSILKIIREVAGLKPEVSVIVPIYNHDRFLSARIESVLNQTFQDFEIFLLDDASVDNSARIASEYADHSLVTFIQNEENSGSPFTQWARGIELADAETIWIAEDDDYCEPQFLEEMLQFFDDPDVKLAYCQSKAVDEDGNILFSYKGLTEDLEPDTGDQTYVVDAEIEVNRGLAIRNIIPNASAVLFRKFDHRAWAEQWSGKQLAGDWALYLYAIQGGKIAFHHEALNYHRRHETTAIYKTRDQQVRFDEVKEVHEMVLAFYEVSQKTRVKMLSDALKVWEEIHGPNSHEAFQEAYISEFTSLIESDRDDSRYEPGRFVDLGDREKREDSFTAMITTVPRSGTMMLDLFMKMYQYFLPLGEKEIPRKEMVFDEFDRKSYANLGFSDFCVAHGYCPGYREIGYGPIKSKWDDVPDSNEWFNAAGAWVEERKAKIYPQLNPKARVVFVYRNPFDFIASMYKHFQTHKSRAENGEVDLDGFIHATMPQYMKSVVSHRRMAKLYPESVRLFSYEQLVTDRAGTLRDILEFLEQSIESVPFQRALDFTEPESLRELEIYWGETLARDQSASVEEVSHMRGGGIGKYRTVLSPQQVKSIQEYVWDYEISLFSEDQPLLSWPGVDQFRDSLFVHINSIKDPAISSNSRAAANEKPMQPLTAGNHGNKDEPIENGGGQNRSGLADRPKSDDPVGSNSAQKAEDRMPTFLIIGANKAGTSALHIALDQHPEIYMSSIKEPMFFVFDGEEIPENSADAITESSMIINNLHDYQALFSGAQDEIALGESSTAYLANPSAAAVIHQYIPDVRLICILRNPIERAYSCYRMYVEHGLEDRMFLEAVEQELHNENIELIPQGKRYLHLGKYADAVEHYLRRFGPDQLKIFLYEEWRHQPEQVLASIYQYIGVSPAFEHRSNRDFNVSVKSDRGIVHWRRISNSSLSRSVLSNLPGHFQERIRDVVIKAFSGDQLTPRVKEILVNFYKDDLARLEEIIGRDLGHWLD